MASTATVDQYLDDNFDSEAETFEVGTCRKHTPKHTVQAYLYEGDILFECSDGTKIKWSHMGVCKELSRLSNNKTTTKQTLKQRLELYISRQVTDLVKVPGETDVIILPQSGTGAESDSEVEGIVESPAPGSPVVPASPSLSADGGQDLILATQQLSLSDGRLKSAADSKELEIFIYQGDQTAKDATDGVNVFNMWHVGTTVLANAGTLAIQGATLYYAVQENDGIKFWSTILDAFGAYLPAPLAQATTAARLMLGPMLGNRVSLLQQERFLKFVAPKSVTSDAAQVYTQSRAQAIQKCEQPGSERGKAKAKTAGKK